MEYDFQNRKLEYDQESNRIPMEYNCHIFSKYLVFQMKDLVFQSKYLVFRLETLDLDRSTRYFESEVSKYQVFHTLNSKYQVFRAKGLVFKKGVKSPVISGFYVCPLASAIQSKFQVFKILGISLEISSFLNSRCERPSISKFLIQNPRKYQVFHLKYQVFRKYVTNIHRNIITNQIIFLWNTIVTYFQNTQYFK